MLLTILATIWATTAVPSLICLSMSDGWYERRGWLTLVIPMVLLTSPLYLLLCLVSMKWQCNDMRRCGVIRVDVANGAEQAFQNWLDSELQKLEKKYGV